MIEQQGPAIDYYVWLLSDWAYLGGFRFVQLAKRHGLKINHIPMRMQDVYAGSGGILLGNRSWQRQAYRITELKRWRSRLGIPVNIEPKFFPCDVDLASCVVIAGQRRGLPITDFVNAMMRAIWAEDQNVAEPDVLIAIADVAALRAASYSMRPIPRRCAANTAAIPLELSPQEYSGHRSTYSKANFSGARTASTCWKRKSCGQPSTISAVPRLTHIRRGMFVARGQSERPGLSQRQFQRLLIWSL